MDCLLFILSVYQSVVLGFRNTFSLLADRAAHASFLSLIVPFHSSNPSLRVMDTLSPLMSRIAILESQIKASGSSNIHSFGDYTRKSTDIESVLVRLSKCEDRLATISSFVEGSRPRSFSKAGEGARSIPYLTSAPNGVPASTF
jgi:hypothetical protein